MKDKKNTQLLSFAAIDPYIDRNIISPKESSCKNTDMVNWGDGNGYPQYLEHLAMDSPTLRAVIQGITDIATGDDVRIQSHLLIEGKYVNQKHQTPRDLAKLVMRDMALYRGFALQVIRNISGAKEVYHLPMAYIRSDKDNEQFWYSEKWESRRTDANLYERYVPEFNQGTSILFYKGDVYTTYPQPFIAAAVRACEVESCIDDFHLNSIENGFMGSYLINMNSGIPSDEMMEEIESNINEKFSGHSNAGRIMVAFNDSKDNAATLEKMEIADYGDKYETLTKHCRQQIFTSFRANPNLFGIPTESLGFSSEEYDSAFKLFNRCTIQPLQQAFCDALDKIYQTEGTTEIVPFSLETANKTIE